MIETRLKLLDDILSILKDTTDIEPLDFELVVKNSFPKVSNRDRRGIREKLESDNMIKSIIPAPNVQKFIENREYQYITFNGLLFIDSGGYLGKYKRDEENIKSHSKLEKQVYHLYLWIAIGTCAAAFIALLNLVYQYFCS